jgi:hypothetical protein
MEFGLFFLMQRDEEWSEQAVYDSGLEQMLVSRDRARRRPLEARSWGMRVVHVAPAHEEAWRAIEAPFMGYQRRMSVLRSDSTGGSVPGSFDLCYGCATFVTISPTAGRSWARPPR